MVQIGDTPKHTTPDESGVRDGRLLASVSEGGKGAGLRNPDAAQLMRHRASRYSAAQLSKSKERRVYPTPEFRSNAKLSTLSRGFKKPSASCLAENPRWVSEVLYQPSQKGTAQTGSLRSRDWL